MNRHSFASLTFSYPAVSLARREEIARALTGLDSEEVFVFSTCLRVEVAGLRADAELVDLVDDVAPGMGSEGKLRTGPDAIRHVFSVACGLESPIRGEREVLTQFRRQVGRRHLAPPLRRIVERAVALGREIRQSINAPRGSLARIAVDRIGEVETLAVIGAGEMARSVVDVVTDQIPATAVTMVVRRPDHVAAPNGVAVVAMDELEDALGSFPVVVSATSASGRLISGDDLGRYTSDRSSHLVLIDLAMPPDFDPPTATNLTYLSVDDLADQIAETTADDGLDAVVADAATEMWRMHRDADEIGPIIGSLFAEVEEVVEATVDRFSGRLGSEGDTELLRQAVRTAVRKVVAKPVDHIHSSESPSETAASVAAAFGLGSGETRPGGGDGETE